MVLTDRLTFSDRHEKKNIVPLSESCDDVRMQELRGSSWKIFNFDKKIKINECLKVADLRTILGERH
jgi:hypothetical protein